MDGSLDKRYLHNHGLMFAKSAERYALMWLTKNMRNVSRHTTYLEGVNTFKEQVLIYPRWDMDIHA